MPVPTQATISPTSGAAPLNCTGSLTGGFSNSWTGTYWDWGDGSPTTSVSYPFTSNHTYSTPGTFVAQFHFVAFSIPGTLSTPNITVTGGVASFTFSPASPTVGQTVTFTSTSTGATSYLWNFGDGNTSTLQNPTHAFSTANTFSVSLTINGGVSTVSHSVTTTPVAGFTFSPASPTIIDTVNFTDTSLGATSWFWDFGDGYTSSVQNPVHQYSTPNTYSVFLSINGGASTITNPITVAGVAPVASFTYDPLNFVSNQTVNFTDTSSYFPTSWQWDFGDGNTSTLQNPSHAYSGAGKFTVTLIAGNNIGTNSTSQSFIVTITDFVELSPVFMSTFPSNIISFGKTDTSPNAAQSGLLSIGSPVNAKGYISIMQGTIPAQPDISSVPTSDILVEFSSAANHFLIRDMVNPVIISSINVPAIRSGTATWFWWSARDDAGTIYQQAIGTVDVIGNTADLNISDVNVVAGKYYRILNLRLLFPSIWQPPVVVTTTDYYFSFDTSTGNNAAYPTSLGWPGSSAGWNQETTQFQFGDAGVLLQNQGPALPWNLPSIKRSSSKWTMEFSLNKAFSFGFSSGMFDIFQINPTDTFGFSIGLKVGDLPGSSSLYFKSFNTAVEQDFGVIGPFSWGQAAISIDLVTNTIQLYYNGQPYNNLSWSGIASSELGALPPEIYWDMQGLPIDSSLGTHYMDELRLSYVSLDALYPAAAGGNPYTPPTGPFPIP